MKSISFLLLSLAPAVALAESSTPAAGGQGGFTPFIPLLLIFGVFYFLILRPQQKKAKEHQKFLSELKRGDMVVTNAGIIGTVRTLSDKFVTLEVDEGVTLKMLRSQIAENAAALNKEEVKGKTGLFAPATPEK